MNYEKLKMTLNSVTMFSANAHPNHATRHEDQDVGSGGRGNQSDYLPVECLEFIVNHFGYRMIRINLKQVARLVTFIRKYAKKNLLM